MSTSEWLDVATLLSSNDICVSPDGPADAEIPEGNETLLAAMDGQPKAQVSASIRWAVCAGIEGEFIIRMWRGGGEGPRIRTHLVHWICRDFSRYKSRTIG